MAPSPQRGAVTLTWLHFCTEMIHRKPPGGEGWWLGKVSPEKQEGVFFKGIWCKGQKPSATTC